MGIVDYRNGVVSSAIDLLTSIRLAATENGWTLSAANVLHKTDAGSGNTCYVHVAAVTDNIVVRAGTGIDGTGALTGVNNLSGTDYTIRMGGNIGLTPLVAFPWTYHIHVYDDPDCIFVVIKYNGDFYQHIEWGCSNLAIPGNGTWYSGMTGFTTAGGGISISPRGGGTNSNISGWPFGHSNQHPRQGGFIHHGFDGGGWSGVGTQSDSTWAANEATIIRPVGRLLAAQPNTFNSRPVPQPAVVRVRRADANVSVAATIPALRLLRIDTLAPEEVFSFGTDSWKAYPIYRKNSVTRDGGFNIQHSGTMGFCLAWNPI